jgi:hypothetical protein
MANVRIRDQGKLTLKDSDNSNEVSLQSPSTVAADQDFIVPNADGSANNIITTNASGTLSFTDINTLVTSDIDWQTGDIKTADFIAASGKGYFVDTTGGAITATMPNPPSAGNIVAFKDYAGTFGTNNLTIDRNGHNIQGVPQDSLISTNRASVVLVYNADAVSGWLYTVENNVGDLEGPTYIAASGGTETTSGDYKIHTFTSSGTFTVSSVGNSKGGGDGVSYVVVAGGAGAGGSVGAGGGAGGFREGKNSGDPYTASPLNAPAGLTLSAQAYPVTIGSGGAGSSSNGVSGASSVFSTITSAGGGGGAIGVPSCASAGVAGGSGGGGTGGNNGSSFGSGGAGNTPPVSPPQGNTGGNGGTWSYGSAGGGGAGAVGSNGGGGPGAPTFSGAGGAGVTSSINGSPVARSGGGGGGSNGTTAGAGGSGGGGAGANSGSGTAATANTGGGGGGSAFITSGASGGSGVVIIRYKYQN